MVKIRLTTYPGRYVATAAAPEPPPPLKLTVGLEVYPDPPFVSSRAVTLPARLAVAVAPVPPPPVKLTAGAEVYPLPPLVTVTEATA